MIHLGWHLARFKDAAARMKPRMRPAIKSQNVETAPKICGRLADNRLTQARRPTRQRRRSLSLLMHSLPCDFGRLPWKVHRMHPDRLI